MKFTAAFLALTVASASAFAPASPAARTCEFLIFEMKGSKRYAGLSDVWSEIDAHHAILRCLT